MLGLNNYVIVIVINALSTEDKKLTNFFDRTYTVRLAAIKTMSTDTIGNPHNRSNIQKQVYPSESIKVVKQAYGFTGTKYNTHTAYRNGRPLLLNDEVYKNQEIVLIKNDLNLMEALKISNTHRIIPERTG